MAIREDRKGKTAGGPRLQYAALPFRRESGLEVMLVSSRETRRWVIPKGWPMKGLKPHAAAAREALEEAGLEGKVGKQAIGSYTYGKRMPDGSVVSCRVEVYPLEVAKQRKAWPEKGERTTRWFSAEEAAGAVEESELGELIRDFVTERAAVGEKA
ncbi:NUDIX hydrolase [Prosthecomicrobium sp. N25]|uniref:NUDIX hydrolase n=1 Tax=Prosthecomicrobium sp. N25 TaxID=3129254 RepID=UPI003077A262